MRWDDLREAFHNRHEQTFGRADRHSDVELVNITLFLIDKPELSFSADDAEIQIERRKSGLAMTGRIVQSWTVPRWVLARCSKGR